MYVIVLFSVLRLLPLFYTDCDYYIGTRYLVCSCTIQDVFEYFGRFRIFWTFSNILDVFKYSGRFLIFKTFPMIPLLCESMNC